MKITRQHTDYHRRVITERRSLAEDVAASTVSRLPRTIAQHRDPGRGSQILARHKIAAQDRSDAQGSKESVADPGGPHRLGALRNRQRIALALIDVQGAEYGAHPLPIEVVGIGEVALRSQGVRLEDAD
jgi:hypothetical protein